MRANLSTWSYNNTKPTSEAKKQATWGNSPFSDRQQRERERERERSEIMNHALMAEAKTKRFVSRCANVCGPPAICLFFPKLPNQRCILTAKKNWRSGEEDKRGIRRQRMDESCESRFGQPNLILVSWWIRIRSNKKIDNERNILENKVKITFMHTT